MKIRWVVSSRCWRLIQRRRARATSGRSCSAASIFLKGNMATLQEPVESAAAECDPSPAKHYNILIQRQIRTLCNHSQNCHFVRLQRRPVPTTRLSRKLPVSRKRCAHLIAALTLISKCSTGQWGERRFWQFSNPNAASGDVFEWRVALWTVEKNQKPRSPDCPEMLGRVSQQLSLRDASICYDLAKPSLAVSMVYLNYSIRKYYSTYLSI